MPRAHPLLDDVRRALIAVRSDLAPDDISASARLTDLGIDSLKVVELILALEDVFARPVNLPEWISGVAHPDELTVGSLCAFLDRSFAP